MSIDYDSVPAWLRDAPLQIELVPATSWGDNLRSRLKRSDWNRLRLEQFKVTDHKCEICGGQGRNHALEGHEIWSYDETDFVQKLERLIGLCPACHRCKHPGNTHRIGMGHLVEPHLMRVNGWTQDQAQMALGWAFDVWQWRSQFEWTLDLSWLESHGVTGWRQ